MFHLAAPLGLLALGALTVPILIHLVRRPLQVVKLGSLRFLRADQRRLRSFRWHQRLLLALRCALLTALALLLASLVWQPAQPKPARWLVQLPDATLDPAAETEWARLLAEGFEPHNFPIGTDPWSFLQETDARVPADSRITIFGPPSVRYLPGTRPTLIHTQVAWWPTPSSQQPPSLNPPAPRALVIAAANRGEDARYLRAMLAALGATTDESSPDWIFLLGDAPLPDPLLQRVKNGGHLVSDSADASPALPVTRSFTNASSTARLLQRTAAPAGSPLLLDSAGEALLTTVPLERGTHWHFALRFHPDWSDWVLSSAFPAWWQEQLRPENLARIAVSSEQAAPRFRAAALPAFLAGFGEKDLRFACWLAAVVLFAIERFLSRPTRADREASA